MASPMFPMSLEIKPTFFPRPSARSRSVMTSQRDFRDAPIYITGFPGFDQLQTSNTTVTFNKYSMESTDHQTSTQYHQRLDLQEYEGTNDIDHLVDQLQLRDHDTQPSRRGPAPRGPPKPTIQEKKKITPTELSTLFISMFHTQFCKIDKKHASSRFEDNLKRFFLMYMRRWEDTLTFLSESSRIEKSCIQDFKKKHHDKLNRDEWNYFCNFITRTNFSSHMKGFSAFCSLMKSRSGSSSPLGSSPNSPNESSTASWLSLTLMSMSSSSSSSTENISMDEMKRLYICIYFTNYQELWDSDRFVLSGSLVQSIESFLEQNPLPDSRIMSDLLSNMT